MSARTKRGLPRKRVAPGASLEERIKLHVKRKPKTGCWIWQGTKTNGYGRLFYKNTSLFAHRASYEVFVGPIQAGYQIDHLCRTPACVNPEHLEAVTPQVNTLRGMSVGAKAIRSGACKRGHDRSIWGQPMNVRIYCRLCKVAYLRIYNERKRTGSSEPIDLDAVFRNKVLMRRYGLLNLKPEDIRGNGRSGIGEVAA